MRFAKRHTVTPLGPWPPSATPASTTNAWPSCTPTGDECVATRSGRSSLRMPRRRLYSPAGLRHPAGGASNCASARSRASWCTCGAFDDEG